VCVCVNAKPSVGSKTQWPSRAHRLTPVFSLSKLQAGFTETFFEEIKRAGEYVVYDSKEGEGFFINQRNWDKNYVYMPPVTVSGEYSFLSGIAGISPSPDWFTGFYLFDTLKEQGQTFWESFKIRTYPWDAGTDDGTHYEDPDRDTDPPGLVHRIQLGETVDNIFLSPAGDEVPYLAEWECVLHTCPMEDPACEKKNWPPTNGCDVLRFPECAEICDPETMECEQCRRESENEERVFKKDCCLAGRTPKDGRVCENQSRGDRSGAVSSSVTAAIAAAAILGVVALF